MRSNSVALVLIGAVIAVSSKFLLRWNGKHVFNPTNFAIVVMMLATPRVWVSSGQWGSAAFIGFLIACAGAMVVYRSMRSDVTLAFLFFWTAILFARAVRLGDPFTIPIHRLENGALLIFAFFMISDPKTTPNSRAGRILFAALVASGAWFIQFKLFHTNALLWSLAVCSLSVPLIDRVSRGVKFEWKQQGVFMKQAAAALFVLFIVPQAFGFCGFYVAKGDAKLYNKASQVVLVRDGDRTVMTMANDFKGDPKEFAVVIPVPTVLQKGQIRIGDKALIDHLDAYSAPRLVEYFDPDPCRGVYDRAESMVAEPRDHRFESEKSDGKALGVTIEAKYTVGEYDILILSAKESGGLETWLTQNGYRLPPGAKEVLGSYIAQNLKFFVAKVNLTEQARMGFNYLRPIQVALRIAEIHAAHPPRHRECERSAGAVRLRADAQRPRGDDELSHGAPAIRQGRAVVRLIELPGVLQGAVQRAGASRADVDGVHRVRVGHELVRPVRGATAVSRRVEEARRLLAGAGPVERRRHRHVHQPAARPLRPRTLPRRSRVSGDRRSPELPGSLRPPPSVQWER